MYCIGTDIIEIDRFARAVAARPERFLKRIFTPAEISAYGGHIPSLAARFAAKEAAAKALGTGIGEIGWHDIEVLSKDNGQPYMQLHGRALVKIKEKGLESLAVSLSHSRDNAIAFVLGHSH